MTVAVEKGLDEIISQLKSHGYKVVDIGKYADAVVYMHSGDSSFISSVNVPNSAQLGVLIVNAFGKDINEIMHILQTRLYSPLF